jgi:hypothetical protein
MSSKKIAPKHSLTTDEQIKSPPKIETPEPIQKSNTENLEQPKKEKTPKPEELKNFDAVSHFKENIIHFYKNCSEPIKDYSYYCFTCKHSVCNECGVLDHKEHLLIQRDNCLNYDNSFFNDISKVIEDGLNLDSKKSQIKKDISKAITLLKEELDVIEKEKLKEIDNIFKEVKSNYISLKENYLKTKECIENYYKKNKKFFNIKIKHVKQNELENQNNIKKGTEDKNINNNSTNNPNATKQIFINYFNVNENDTGPNRDLENTVFLMNFELMNLCDNKNLQITNISNNINDKIVNMSKLIEINTQEFIDSLKKNYLIFNSEIIQKFDDFYWDVKVRCEKYSDHISQFQNTIYDIYKRNGNLDKLKDLLSLFDSKNNKGKDVLFNQQFFIKMNDLSSLNTDVVKNMAKKLYISNGKIRTTSKGRFMNKKILPSITEKREENKKTGSKQLSPEKNNNENEVKKPIFSHLSKNNNNNLIPRKENVILNQRLIQRFYAYSVLDFYSKYFKINLDAQSTDYDEENNIYLNKDIFDNNNVSDKDKNQIGKHTTRGKSVGSKTKGGKTSDINNNRLNNIKNVKNVRSGDMTVSGKSVMDKNGKKKQNIKSVSLLSNYSERYTELKEKVKPITKTNYIQLFDPATTKITKIKVPLTKEEHGYTTFPDGCRHLLIDSDLYITGGTDNCGYPINIVLLYNLEIGELTRLANLNDNHSYHSVEYLENFDSIILIGGENSSSCEIMDLDSKKWTKLPSLNYPRANANIYYNNITSDLFVLFGMEGEMNSKTRNTDVIEVLELSDIMGGWMMVDYYKSVGLDLKSNYCITLPFTRDKLLVYGGASARSIEKRLFALFDMIKNECIKVDSDTMDLIKREENKIRAFDNALEQIC